MSNLHVINFSDTAEWNEIVTSFRQYDVYYLKNYAKGFHLLGDGEPLLLYYEGNGFRGVTVSMKRDIASCTPFIGILPLNTYYDLVTPYGYGGFLFDGQITKSAFLHFIDEYKALMQCEHIVSNFVRFHPLLRNAEPFREFSNVIDLGSTITVQLDSPELIWANLTTKNRTNIRKAQKSNVQIRHGRSWPLLVEFRKIYERTMKHDHADSYYYFNNEFFRSIYMDLADNHEIFYAVLDEKIISMAIILYANNHMHAHFAGSVVQFRNLYPSNLLFYEAACWGSEQQFKTFHLGGGVCCGEDNLFRFKKSFNCHSSTSFSIGKIVFNQEVYDFLISLRRETDPDFNLYSNYFPLYRSTS